MNQIYINLHHPLPPLSVSVGFPLHVHMTELNLIIFNAHIHTLHRTKLAYPDECKLSTVHVFEVDLDVHQSIAQHPQLVHQLIDLLSLLPLH